MVNYQCQSLGGHLLSPKHEGGGKSGGDPSDSAEEGRSDSQAAPSERQDAARTTPDNGEDVRSAPESGTRDKPQR